MGRKFLSDQRERRADRRASKRQALDEAAEDAADLTLARERMAAWDGTTVPLADLVAESGITQAEIDEAVD